METTTNQDLTMKEELAQLVASIRELRVLHDEDFRKRTQEWERTQKEKELEWEKRALGWEEIKQMQRDTAAQMKETDRKISELGGRFGELAEHLVAPGIAAGFYVIEQSGDTMRIDIQEDFIPKEW